MPGLGRYPCPTCHYVASNRRMLARHAVLIHSVKSFKCPLCPFITRYAANWYRHKRDLHGLTKLTTCEVCGFFANSTEELAEHKETEHLELLQLHKYEDKYAKEKLRLGAEPATETCQSDVVDVLCEVRLEENSDIEPQEDLPTLSRETENDPLSLSSDEVAMTDDSITFSLPLNGGLLESDYASMKICAPETETPKSEAMNSTPVSDSSNTLKPLRVRRSYCCDQCGLLTSDPREYLYHCRDTHGEKITVHECKYCIYASKHIQKLQRHCNLVHRQQVAKENELRKQLEAKEKKTVDDVSIKKLTVSKETARKRTNPNLLKCSACSYQTRNKMLMIHHEKTVHLKKKFYRCLQCGYVTNEKSRYTKHIKYHNLPKMQCEFCFFKTAYKWNMERHMRNHISGAEGEYNCTLCNFTTSSKQSLKSHVTNHHDITENGNSDLQDDLIAASDDKESVLESLELQWEENAQQEPEEEEEEEDLLLQPSVPEEGSPLNEESSEVVWKHGKVYKKHLKCRSCDFKAAWPFELKKHEETHKSLKKHPCPLCGMRFEHIAWLTKHLCRVHKENSQAKNIAAAFELLKPNRRRPAREIQSDAILPMFQEVLKQTGAIVDRSQSTPKSSMLSSLLKKPTYTPIQPTPNKFQHPSKQRCRSSTSASKQSEILSYLQAPSKQNSTEPAKEKGKSVPTCSVCGYKTRWISELQRHMRVHTQEKPFQCQKCKYHCKWKGDLNRHLMKYHGIKVPPSTKRNAIPKLKLKKASSSKFYSASDWETVNQDTNQNSLSTSGTDINEQDSPLDLRLSKSTFPHPFLREDIFKACDFESSSVMDLSKETVRTESSDFHEFNTPRRSSLASSLRSSSSAVEEIESAPVVKRKYQCPFCIFSTSTASRFHVHIVQHYNKRPFMCSLCGYRSNWEWDITKHIRLKGCKDKAHNKACVLLTDETGRRNYDKYEKYLVDADQIKPMHSKSSGNSIHETRYNTKNSNDTSNKSCSYDFKNIGSNFEDSPVNIVVTPDINIPETHENLEKLDNSSLQSTIERTAGKLNDFKFYFCKHCNYKHSTKRVVISHLAVHAGLKPFRCRACGLSSNWRHVIVRHVKDAHDGYMNEVEDRITFVQEGYAIRLTSVNTTSQDVDVPIEKHIPQFGCKLCPYKCDKEFYIKFHMKQHKPRDGAIYKCTFCPYFVKFKKTLVRHMKLHNNVPTSDAISAGNSYSTMNVNNYNGDSFVDNDPLDDIYNYNNQFNNGADDSIAISFDQLQSSNIDQPTVAKIKRHVCENCPYKTDNKTQYLYHKQFHRPNLSAPFKCNVCSYWATMQHLLTQHMKVHADSNTDTENERTYNTDNSHSIASEKSDETSSINSPEEISIVYVKRGDVVAKMFKCNYCPMMNKKRANVRVHQKMHGVVVNDGKFACTFCNYQCLNQGGLTNHMKIHRRNLEKETILDQTVDDAADEKYETVPEDKCAVDGSNALRKKVFSYFCMRCPAVFKSSSDLHIHKKFHGSTLPFSCPHCDYSARHKPHLFKHLQVHTPKYVSKRNDSQGPPVNSKHENASEFTDSLTMKVNVVGNKKIDQMLLLEASEVKASLKNARDFTNKLHRCVFCPASFYKTSTLAYHISLHGSGGEFKCSQCDYSTTRSANLSTHSLVHSKKTSVKRNNTRTFNCPKCPAVFYKQDRYDRHADLHGKKYRYVCDQCDYSVRFAANLFKHKTVHINSVVPESPSPVTNNDSSISTVFQNMAIATSPQSAKLQNENVKSHETEDKKTYICDRCPYFQTRKDAVQSHQRRHWQRDGLKCPYCDYSSMQSSYLRDHIRTHIQPTQLFPAQAFMKYETFEIWRKEDNTDSLLFEDKGFCKHVESSIDTTSKGTDIVKKSSNSQKILKASFETLKSLNGTIQTTCNTTLVNTTNIIAEQCIKPNPSPIVVLSDIFETDKDLKRWAPERKISSIRKKLKTTNFANLSNTFDGENLKLSAVDSCFSTIEKSRKNAPDNLFKPSIVVKIKVENCLKDNCEKTLYSVSTKKSEDTKEVISDANIPVDFEESSNNIRAESPVLEIAESYGSNSSGIDKREIEIEEAAAISSVEPLVEVVIGPSDCELSNEKSASSYNDNDVPVVLVTDVLSDQLESLSDLKFSKGLNSLMNGDNVTHLSKLNLFTDEVQAHL